MLAVGRKRQRGRKWGVPYEKGGRGHEDFRCRHPHHCPYQPPAKQKTLHIRTPSICQPDTQNPVISGRGLPVPSPCPSPLAGMACCGAGGAYGVGRWCGDGGVPLLQDNAAFRRVPDAYHLAPAFVAGSLFRVHAACVESRWLVNGSACLCRRHLYVQCAQGRALHKQTHPQKDLWHLSYFSANFSKKMLVNIQPPKWTCPHRPWGIVAAPCRQKETPLDGGARWGGMVALRPAP